MRITVFASGSSGNCLLVESGNTRLLIDAGVSVRRMTKGLSRGGLTWRDIDGVLITHEHSDHISGLKTLIHAQPVPIYAPGTVAAHLFGKLPGIEERLHVIPVGETFPLGSVYVMAFHTPHDTQESVGYRIAGDEVFAVSTDMGCVTDEILQGLTGARVALIEANHDIDMLSYGPYPVALKRRILSTRGHLSNSDCAALAATLAGQGTELFILGHISKENNRPQLAEKTVREALGEATAAVVCAPADGCLTIEFGGGEPCRLLS